MQQQHDNTGLVTAEQRRNEIAGILAAAILRLSIRAALSADGDPKKTENSAPNWLEVPDETRLSGHAG
jgi:hypothetical protein